MVKSLIVNYERVYWTFLAISNDDEDVTLESGYSELTA